MNQTSTLFQLQQINSEIDQVNVRLGEIEAILNEDEVLRNAQDALQQIQDDRLHWRTRQTDLELNRKQLKEEADATEDRLYSGRVLNPRELTDLQDKLAELRERHTVLEEPLLEAMFNLEEATEAEQAASARIEEIKAERASQFGELTAEQQTAEQRRAGLAEKERARRAEVSAPHLALYDSLRKRPGGIAVAAIQGGECSVCGVEINSRLLQQVRRGEVQQCSTCERILYHR